MSDPNPMTRDVTTQTPAAADPTTQSPAPPQSPQSGHAASETGAGPLTAGSAAVLKLARQATARIVTAALEATAESADMERADLVRRFPAMTSLPAPLRLDPQQIRDFARSDDYQLLVEHYIQGRIQGHLLTRLLELLSRSLPMLFAR